MKACGKALKQWNQRSVGSLSQQIHKKKAELALYFDSTPAVSRDDSQMKLSMSELRELEKCEEVYWRQRSKSLWLKEGDRNTSYFHSVATKRRANNQIVLIRDESNIVHSEPSMIEVFTDYFSHLFFSSNPRGLNDVFSKVSNRLTIDMIQQLNLSWIASEVKQALGEMHPSKAPGPDGMTTMFYQKYWHTVGKDVTKSVLDFMNNGSSLADINQTNITLIPKIKKPRTPKDYRPISLCNVLYKIVSKVLANRLKNVLPHLISASQSAFVLGRLIIDNVIVAYETVHALKGRKKGKKLSYGT